MEVPDHLRPLLTDRYANNPLGSLTFSRVSINRAEAVAVAHKPDALDLGGPYGVRWGSEWSINRSGDVKPYVGIPLDENGFIIPNQPFYHATSGSVLAVVPPQPGALCPPVVSEMFDPINGERLGKVPNACYKVELLQKGDPVTGEITTEQGAQKPSPKVESPASLNLIEWLKKPFHGGFPVPRGILLAIAGIGVGYYALK